MRAFVTEAERIARSHRAQAAWDEFFAPMLNAMRDEYLSRIAEVASTELHPTNRADKITTLSIALRVRDNLESGMLATIRDGGLALDAKLKAERIAQMSDAQQRLLKITGY